MLGFLGDRKRAVITGSAVLTIAVSVPLLT